MNETTELDVTARSWDEYLENTLPKVLDNLRSWERPGKKDLDDYPFNGLYVALPIEAREKGKETQLIESIAPVASEVKEKLRKQSYFSILKDSFTNKTMDLRRAAVYFATSFLLGGLGYLYGGEIGALTGIVAGVSASELMLTGQIYSRKNSLIRTLSNLNDNITFCYKRENLIVTP